MVNSRPHGPLCAQALVPAAAAALLLLAGCAPVEYVYVPPPAPAYVAAPSVEPVAADPLDQLLGPVALYPDPLISILLPAAAFPTDIAAAGAYISGGGDLSQVDAQPWDASVRSLAHYPSVVTWMAQNGTWTQSVGAAFVSQPAQVMEAIQRLRELARAAGTLANTPQQQVIVQGGYVEIEPAQAGVIYVPRYDPAIVFVDQPYYGFNGPFFTYGPAYGAGVWLTYGCNWGGGGVVVVGPGYWHERGGWWRPYGGEGRGEFGASVSVDVSVRPWGFPSNRERPEAPRGWQNESRVEHPSLAAGLPAHPPQSAFRNIHTRGAAAVTAVARNPAAFKGKPINRAILSRSASSRGAAPVRPEENRPRAQTAAAPARPPGQPRESGAIREAKPVANHAAAPAERVQPAKAQVKARPAKAPAPKARKKAKPAKKKPEDGRPSQ